MKTLCYFLMLTGYFSSLFAQEDPIVMHVNGIPVPKSEFEYNYNKNNDDGVLDKKKC